MESSAYNNIMQVFQTEDHVVILNEMVNDSRIVPLDGRAHLPGEVEQWRGDSRGRWEGDTLVIDTTNFTAKTSVRGSGPGLHLVERLTRVDDGDAALRVHRRAIRRRSSAPGRWRCR